MSTKEAILIPLVKKEQLTTKINVPIGSVVEIELRKSANDYIILAIVGSALIVEHSDPEILGKEIIEAEDIRNIDYKGEYCVFDTETKRVYYNNKKTHYVETDEMVKIKTTTKVKLTCGNRVEVSEIHLSADRSHFCVEFAGELGIVYTFDDTLVIGNSHIKVEYYDKRIEGQKSSK